MITEKVLGAYTIVGTLSPTEQADWYRKAIEEWNINTFEVPILAGVPLLPEVVDVLTELSTSIVATFVAQWATAGQKNPRMVSPHWTNRPVKQHWWMPVHHCSNV